nr:retrovirus-related Pol polyprotein from transposon TNT 1-94 [Tanacetum cinerariifolium]
MEETVHVTFSEDDEAVSQSNTEGDAINFNENRSFLDDEFLKLKSEVIQYLGSTNDDQPSPSIPPSSDVILQTRVPQERWSKENHIELVNIIVKPFAGIRTRSRIKDSDAASASECIYVNFLSKMEHKKLIEALEEEGNSFERKNSGDSDGGLIIGGRDVGVIRFFIIAVQTPGSGISILLAVGTPSTGSGKLYCQWELSPGSGNALCILFPTKSLVRSFDLQKNKISSTAEEENDKEKLKLAEYKEREVKYIETIRSLERDKEYNLRKINKLTSEVETLQEEKDVVDGKLARLLKSSKDLKDIIESQRSENVKERVGYNVVPPPAADLYHSPKKDLSWTGLPEFADDTVTDYSRPTPTVESTSAEGQNKISTTAENGESTDSILSKPAVKFVMAGDKPAERPTTNKAKFMKAAERPTTDKVEIAKKPAVRYAEMYRRTSKRYTVRGNQRNWNNLKSQQLGPDFAMKKNACYNCGNFSHLANDCRRRVQRETTRSQNHAYKSPPLRPAGHKTHGPPMRPSHRPAGHRPHGPPMRPQYKAPWVPTVNRNFPPVNRKLPTGNSNVSTVCCCCSRHVNTARPKAVINRRNRVKDVQASASWVWKSDGKLAGLLKASKNLDNLIESHRFDKIKDGVGYNAVPPPAADLYLSPK